MAFVIFIISREHFLHQFSFNMPPKGTEMNGFFDAYIHVKNSFPLLPFPTFFLYDFSKYSHKEIYFIGNIDNNYNS